MAPTVHEGIPGRDPGIYESRALCTSPTTMIGPKPGHHCTINDRMSDRLMHGPGGLCAGPFPVITYAYCHSLSTLGYSTDLPSRHSRGRDAGLSATVPIHLVHHYIHPFLVNKYTTTNVRALIS
jgi:hypothetical protein